MNSYLKVSIRTAKDLSDKELLRGPESAVPPRPTHLDPIGDESITDERVFSWVYCFDQRDEVSVRRAQAAAETKAEVIRKLVDANERIVVKTFDSQGRVAQ